MMPARLGDPEDDFDDEIDEDDLPEEEIDDDVGEVFPIDDPDRD
jgi:hypothetical protein